MLLVELIDNLEKMSFFDILNNVLKRHLTEIAKLNKDQLWDGKTYRGENITPKYVDDPYFKTKKQALGYAKWKSVITKNPNRNFNAPNLNIKGVFYGNIYAAIAGEYIEIGAMGFGENFQTKWKDIFGLTEDHLDLIRAKILPELVVELKNEIGI